MTFEEIEIRIFELKTDLHFEKDPAIRILLESKLAAYVSQLSDLLK